MDCNVDMPLAKRGRDIQVGDKLVLGGGGSCVVTGVIGNIYAMAFGGPPSVVVSDGQCDPFVVGLDDFVEYLP